MSEKKRQGPRPIISVDVKLRAVQERLRGTREADIAKAFGVSKAAVSKWLGQYRKNGTAGLEPKLRGGKAKAKKPSPQRERVVAVKREHETWGTRRIRDVLRRFEALGVSEQQVRRILHDEEMIESPSPRVEREHPVRRFERAAPNQLWQSDIFTFLHRRQERLYVCVFMDDHSRFVVGSALAHHQRSALVMEAFERGVAAFGQPGEVLTDNGRQYTVWRGETEFEIALRRLGIRHIRSRPQHPQTLGKVERFWKTLWDEFLGRTVFAHYVDAQKRLEHFLQHYNFQRPHQALDGLVPADRFFRAAAHVRAEVERQVAANALRLALEQPPRKPFYVVGQLGDQSLSIAAGGNGLEVRVGDTTQTIPLKGDDHETRTARRFPSEPGDAGASDTSLADPEDGPRRDRAESSADGAVGLVGGEARDDGDRGGRDLEGLLLPTRDQGAQRDAPGAGPRLSRRREPERDGPEATDSRSRREGRATRAAAETDGEAQLRSAQADRPCEDRARSSAEGNTLDDDWAERLALAEDQTEDEALDAELDDLGEHDLTRDYIGSTRRFDALAGWRERGPLNWDRKLAGAFAPSDRLDEAHDDQAAAALVHASARTTERSGDPSTLRTGHRDHLGAADGVGSSPRARHAEESLPDDPAPRARWADRGPHSEASGPAGDATSRSSAAGGERSPAGEGGSARVPSCDDRPPHDRRRGNRFGTRIGEPREEQGEEVGYRGPRTSELDDDCDFDIVVDEDDDNEVGVHECDVRTDRHNASTEGLRSVADDKLLDDKLPDDKLPDDKLPDDKLPDDEPSARAEHAMEHARTEAGAPDDRGGESNA